MLDNCMFWDACHCTIKSKVEIKAETTKDNNGDSEIQQGTSKNGHKTSKNSKKALREKVKDNLERLAKKAAKEQESEVNVDLTKSQKEIQKLENLLDAAQVGHVHQFAISYMCWNIKSDTLRILLHQ